MKTQIFKDEDLVLENSKGFSNLAGSFIVFLGLAYFVVGYKYYSVNYYNEIFINSHFSSELIFGMLAELGQHLAKFIQDAYTYITDKGVIDFTLYKTFYHYFWDWKITLLIFSGTYLKVIGTPLQRIKKIISFSLVAFIVLLIQIPIS